VNMFEGTHRARFIRRNFYFLSRNLSDAFRQMVLGIQHKFNYKRDMRDEANDTHKEIDLSICQLIYLECQFSF
jgi:hypothetical protein